MRLGARLSWEGFAKAMKILSHAYCKAVLIQRCMFVDWILHP